VTVILGFDTATPATVVAVMVDGGEAIELRHDPEPGQRPGHAQQLLPLARRALAGAGLGFADVERIGVGVGPGTFTGLRIGVATARALAQAGGAELAAVSTLQALAEAAQAQQVLAVLDARRGEAFAGAFRAGVALAEPVAVAPERLPELVDGGAGPWLAVGDGAVRFRDRLGLPYVTVAADGSELHRVSAVAICRLARTAEPIHRDALIPQYVRQPDAQPRRPPSAP
jgi:tRNA threonylcarbamoyladenosine biosynthesis protein TsaB